ncbi:hypothetical protein FISHEDRAFT_78869 [Fistulina hepatica ATCC 64428]|uniref:Uncharacterized protein n=1 Tax=Fistulina hepatica ATCC 64428 TaxID=1128425 RepID=A0A0D6ZZX1_9AGAR|nr:hypothetical protein FISHEDRAFT_78869 [Fistulina hepatica ATCC 64428]
MSIPPNSLLVAGPIFTNKYTRNGEQGTNELTVQLRVDSYVVTTHVWTVHAGTDEFTHPPIVRHIPRILGSNLTVEPATVNHMLPPQSNVLIVPYSPNLVLMSLVATRNDRVYSGLPSWNIYPIGEGVIHRDSLLVAPQDFLGYAQVLVLIASKSYPGYVYLQCIVHRLDGVVDNVIHICVDRRAIADEAEWIHTMPEHISSHVPLYHRIMDMFDIFF